MSIDYIMSMTFIPYSISNEKSLYFNFINIVVRYRYQNYEWNIKQLFIRKDDGNMIQGLCIY